MKKTKPFILLSISTILLLSSNFIQASDDEGSCEGYSFPLRSDNQSINTTWPLRVLRHNAPVYSNARGSRTKRTLKFGDVLDALRISDSRTSGRVEICESGCLPDEALGWMDRQDLLCRIKPLQTQEGLERKAFIKTPAQPEIVKQGWRIDKKFKVPAYPCYNDSCKANLFLSRFHMYFIFAKKQQRYLLAEKYNILMGERLVGWVDEDKIIQWNTTLQLRPKEKVEYVRAYPNLQTINSSRGIQINRSSAVDLAGGKTWYKFHKHIPLLNKVTESREKYYHVSAPGIGMEGFDVEQMNQKTAAVEQLKQVDVFFLLDGTRSMQPSLDAAKKFVRAIVKKLTKRNNKRDYQETNFRFGFRIYRDDFQGSRWPQDESVGKGLPLSGSCQGNFNKNEFYRKIASIKESDERSNEDSSYTENMFKGISQAVKDMANCPNRTKLLFIIGDHGDNQKQVPYSVIQRLTQTFTHEVRLFFVQTNKNGSNNKYQTAYKRFRTQAYSILKQVYSDNYRKNLTTLEQWTNQKIRSQLSSLIAQYVSQYSKSSSINDVMLKLRAGQSVKDIIEQGMKEGDLPVLYWKILEKDLCQAASNQCKHSVDHRVIDAYIPVSENMVEEIWISSRQLDNWKSLLRQLYKNITNKGATDQKTEFIHALKQETQNILGEPLLMEAGETLGEVLKRKNGLPVREHSPFMQYTVGEILEMQRCEFSRLVKWIESFHGLLTRLMSDPSYKIEYELRPYSDSQCPRVSAKGRNLQRLKLKSPKPLGPSDEYRYDHSFRGETIYSIPTKFLP
jgi:hypothetical protein